MGNQEKVSTRSPTQDQEERSAGPLTGDQTGLMATVGNVFSVTLGSGISMALGLAGG